MMRNYIISQDKAGFVTYSTYESILAGCREG
jgi:hypothetical protein